MDLRGILYKGIHDKKQELTKTPYTDRKKNTEHVLRTYNVKVNKNSEQINGRNTIINSANLHYQ